MINPEAVRDSESFRFQADRSLLGIERHPQENELALSLLDKIQKNWGIKDKPSGITDPRYDGIMEIAEASDLLTTVFHGEMRQDGINPTSTHSFHIAHLIANAYINHNMTIDKDIIIAALLHDVPEDTRNRTDWTKITNDHLRYLYNDDVANMVDNLTIARGVNDEELTTETHLKIFEALLKDPRTVVIKLADRLHNMRTIEPLKKESKLKKAHENMEIYVPLAHHLGLDKWAEELTRLSAMILNPLKYEQIETMAKTTGTTENIDHLKSMFSRFTVSESLKDDDNPLIDIKVQPPSFYQLYKENDNSFADVYENQVRNVVTLVTARSDSSYLTQEENQENWQNNTMKLFSSLNKPRWADFPEGSHDYLDKLVLPNHLLVYVPAITSEGNIPFKIRFLSDKEFEKENADIFNFLNGETDPLFIYARDKITRLQQNLRRASRLGYTRNAVAEFTSNLETDFIHIFSEEGEDVTIPAGSLLDAAYSLRTDIAESLGPGTQVIRNEQPLRGLSRATPILEGDQIIIKTYGDGLKSIQVDWLDQVMTSYARDKITKRLRQIVDAEKKALKTGQLQPGERKFTEAAITRGVRIISDLFSQVSSRRGLQSTQLMVGIDTAREIWKNHHNRQGKTNYPQSHRLDRSQEDFLIHVGIGEIGMQGYGRQILLDTVNYLADIQNNLVPIHILAENVPGVTGKIGEAFQEAGINIETGDIWPYQREEGKSFIVFYIRKDMAEKFKTEVADKLKGLQVAGVDIILDAHIFRPSEEK